mgnify:CR=1 FL=1
MKDLTGQRFDRLLVVSRAEKRNGCAYWSCQCNCGNSTICRGTHLRTGGMRSCGCLKSEPRINLTGRRFGRLVVIAYAGNSSWRCRCDCGNESVVNASNFSRTHSCGCLNKEVASKRMTKHGHSREEHNGGRTITWRRWIAMLGRCYDPSNSSYPNYGGRGITVCSGWKIDYVAFLKDMGECPPGLTLDRIENSGGYWCGRCDECLTLKRRANCRWATTKEQARNKTTNRLITLNGETFTAVEWAERSGVPYRIVMQRLYHGWNTEDAVFKSPNPNKAKPKNLCA